MSVCSCSASETGGEEAAGGVQQGERAQEEEGEVRRKGTVQHDQQEPQMSAVTWLVEHRDGCVE